MGALNNRKQFGLLMKVLMDSYPTIQSFERMLYLKLGKRRQQLSLADNYEQVVFEILGISESQYWTTELVIAARAMNPGNEQLFAFAQMLELAPETPNRSGLESLINSTNSLLDIATWREKLGTLESQVCRIEMNDQPVGTGFLVGHNVVMTNYHVVARVIQGEISPNNVTIRFDYKQQPSGGVVSQGVVFTLDHEWLIDYSPYSASDLVQESDGSLPENNELDYALLHIDGSPGNIPIGESEPTVEPGVPTRGWMKPHVPYDFAAQSPLFIAQHPLGQPMKLALETDAIIKTNENLTRVFYKTNTEPGSSGSPCFDQNWNLIALHHSGDPNSQMTTRNAGIPFTPIMKLLRERGVDQLLGEGEDDSDLL